MDELIPGHQGAVEAVEEYVVEHGVSVSPAVAEEIATVALRGAYEAHGPAALSRLFPFIQHDAVDMVVIVSSVGPCVIYRQAEDDANIVEQPPNEHEVKYGHESGVRWVRSLTIKNIPLRYTEKD